MGWSYFPIGIVCPVISEEPKKRTAGLKDIAMERRKRMGLVFVINKGI